MMNDEQILNCIRFETQLSKIHAERAKSMTQFLKNRRAKRAKRTAAKTTTDILGKLSEQTSKQ